MNDYEGIIPVEPDHHGHSYGPKFGPPPIRRPAPPMPVPPPATAVEMDSTYNGGYRSPPTEFHGNNGYQPPTSPVPPYQSPHQNPQQFYSPDHYNPVHEKPIGGPPLIYAANNGMDFPVYGMPPPKEARICGLRRKYFWIILVLLVLLILAAIGAGVGIALSRKNNRSGGSQADPVTSGRSTASISTTVGGVIVQSSTSTTSEESTTTPEYTTPEYTSPEPTTPDYTTPEPTTPEYSTPEPTTPDYTTPDYTTPDYTTPAPETTTTPDYTTPDYTSPAPETTATPDIITTPDVQTSPPSSPTTPPDTSPPNTTPADPTSPEVTSFTLETGYNTMVVTATSYSGDICSVVLPDAGIAATTTIWVSLDGTADDYTAYWQLDGLTATFVATGVASEATTPVAAWSFQAPWNANLNGCLESGSDAFVLGDNGVAVYSSGYTLQSDCQRGSVFLPQGESCYLYWAGYYS
ncbi:hypothetical protein H072_10298 [Dactylellina haptotyla CBS 200.50]|uniref:Uncharacterized protein n=1 Tax=Dactylellina haptotyla (strain CBS 200.50) TaxID=1284197 RepID=S8BLQ4_DACHA|nr:hypothetical protein H072_10298 [Dactylellina haptotyla CBS 200.50]